MTLQSWPQTVNLVISSGSFGQRNIKEELKRAQWRRIEHPSHCHLPEMLAGGLCLLSIAAGVHHESARSFCQKHLNLLVAVSHFEEPLFFLFGGDGSHNELGI